MTDREKLITLVDEAVYAPHAEVCAIADHLVANAVVPVVRCKDCRFWVREFDNVGHCTYAGIHLDHAEYGFCSYGERRSNEA